MLSVLYIEDNPSNARLVQRLVDRRRTVDLQIATTGAEGLRLATRLRPDLVLLDLHLPDLPGEVVLDRLRALPGPSPMAVVVVTADATAATTAMLLARGVTEKLTKPLDVQAFYDQLDRVEAQLVPRQRTQAC